MVTVQFSAPAGIEAPAAVDCGPGETITLPAADAPEAANGASKTIPYLGFSANNYFVIDRTANPKICFRKPTDAHEVTIYTTVID